MKMSARKGKRRTGYVRMLAESYSFSSPFLMTSGLFFFYLLFGGSSRFDNLSLPLLRLIAVLGTFYGLWQLPKHRPKGQNALLAIMAAIIVVVALYLVPLPPSIWSALPGRTVIVEVDQIARLGDVYRPATISPALTLNALFALFVPASILVNGLCLTDDELRRLAPVVMIGALCSCLLAVVQLLGPSDGPLYLYRSTTNGAAVGLFANRNHHAVFLASVLPVILVYAATSHGTKRRDGRGQSQRRSFAALLLACLILPMLLVIGSRGGFAAAIAALICLPLLYRAAAKRTLLKSDRHVRLAIIAVATMMAGIILWAIFSPRAETLARMTNPGGDQELRFKVWPVILDHLRFFGSWGPGPGTYEVAYKLIEPDQDLRPTYSNHAHNDWLEVPFTMGIPGVLLLVTMAVLLIRAIIVLILRRSSLPDRGWGWTGVIMLLAYGIGSTVDYPLRVPSLEAAFVIACLWIGLGATARPITTAPSTAAD